MQMVNLTSGKAKTSVENRIRLAVYSQTLTMQTAHRFNIGEKIVTKGESLNDDDTVEKVQTIQIQQFHQNREH